MLRLPVSRLGLAARAAVRAPCTSAVRAGRAASWTRTVAPLRSVPVARATGARWMSGVVDAEFVDKDPSAANAAEEKHSFQAETRKLLDIVTNSLYTDRHIFIRELISNASDALEKARHLQTSGAEIDQPDAPLEIRITTDPEARTITFEDTGVGFTREELKNHLGTIARSGSKEFLTEMASKGSAGDLSSNLIGQFGVGFYSAFMVGDTVDVFSNSALTGHEGYKWSSRGDGEYTIAASPGAKRGTKIVVNLKDSDLEFTKGEEVEKIIKTHSYFVPFPLFLNGKQVNTVQPVWAMSKSDITEEMYEGFYKHVSKGFDKPTYRLHFTSDAPVDLKALFYVGEMSREKFGAGIQPPGVSLYSHKVLIEPESKILPQWLRFIFGVVDSEDIPLNISRESMQDSALLVRIRSLLTRRFLRFLDTEAKRDPAKYAKFFKEFGLYIKEGICTDQAFQEDCAKLLRFESSALGGGELTSLDEYISRCEPSQSSVYYIIAPNRKLALASPYMEAFKGRNGKKDTEVLFMYQNPIDDFVMSNLGTYNNRKLTTAEVGSLDVAKDGSTSEDGDKSEAETTTGLDEANVKALSDWLVDVALAGKLSSVQVTTRLVESPAVITDHESAAMRRMHKLVQQSADSGTAAELDLPKQKLEINPKHPIITGLDQARRSNPPLAITIAEQIFDNALTAAGLMDDPRVMLPRLNALLEVLTTRSSVGSGMSAPPPPPMDDAAGASSSASDSDDYTTDSDAESASDMSSSGSDSDEQPAKK